MTSFFLPSFLPVKVARACSVPVLTLVVLTLLAPHASAQCNVRKGGVNGIVKYVATLENLQDHTNSGRGSYHTLMALTNLDYSPSANAAEIYISIGTNAFRTQDVIPRSVQFTFEDGSTLNLRARRYEAFGSGAGRIHLGEFRLQPSDSERLLSSAVSRVVVTDDRTGGTAEARPYRLLFAEQISCVVSHWERDYPGL